MKTILRRLAHVRSGDKGNTATVSVIAYAPDFYPLLKAQVTETRVRERYGAAVAGKVTRYEIDAIEALNFTLEGALGGGVSRNLAIDVYGKALCAAMLDIEVDVPEALVPLLAGPPEPLNVLGSWELVDYRRHEADRTVLPYGDDPMGFLQYGADGRMSATLCRRDRPPMTRPVDAEWRGDEGEWARAAMSYFAYTGTWNVEGDRVEHQVEASLFPNWIGKTLTRWASFVERDGERLLLLVTHSPEDRAAGALTSELLWRRWTR